MSAEHLTDAEIQEIKQLLEAKGRLPREWKGRLFPAERREAELTYGNKTREEDILAEAMGVPAQTVRTFNVPADCDPETWVNRLVFGDNLQALKGLVGDSQVAGKVRFVYIDPPFATKGLR